MKSLKIGNLCASVPIVQGGMGVGISLAGLASAVADEGGIGVISSAGLGAIYNDYSKDYRAASIWGLKQELRKAREATRGIIRESRHHLLGRRTAAQPAVVLARGGQNQVGAHRLVGPGRSVVVPQMVLGVPLRARRHRGRGA